MTTSVVCIETNHTERLLLTARFEYLRRPPPQFVAHKDALDAVSGLIAHGVAPTALVALRPLNEEDARLPARIRAMCGAISRGAARTAALTCLSKAAHISELRSRGFDKVLVKPYSVLDLSRVLDALAPPELDAHAAQYAVQRHAAIA